jgi:hypothetical protein
VQPFRPQSLEGLFYLEDKYDDGEDVGGWVGSIRITAEF